MSLRQRPLGTQGLEVGAIGLGCMGMSQSYGPADEKESIATLHHAADLRCNFFDTAEGYGPYTNEELLGRAFKGRRDQVAIATKVGFCFENDRQMGADTDSRPESVRLAVEGCLRRLQTDHIDLLYQHRIDREVPIEEFAGAVGDMVCEGKCATSASARFDANVKAAQVVFDITKSKAVKPGQVSLAWLLGKGDFIVPIPDTKRRGYLEENVASAEITLDASEVERLDSALAAGTVSGNRYNDFFMTTIER